MVITFHPPPPPPQISRANQIALQTIGIIGVTVSLISLTITVIILIGIKLVMVYDRLSTYVAILNFSGLFGVCVIMSTSIFLCP